MKSSLYNLWTIGKIKWRSDDCATLQVARTKTTARIIAERQLAHAYTEWPKHEKATRRMWDQYSKSRFPNFDKYAEAVVFGKYHCSDSYYLRMYLLIKDGIWIYGPNGESEHITKPSKKAIQERIKKERDADCMMRSIIKSIKL